jgi:hypothetical protein
VTTFREPTQRVIAQQPGDEYAFMRAFYTEVLNGQVRSADQFQNKYTNLKLLLEHYGIAIDANAEISDEDAGRPAFLDLISRLRSSLRFERHPDSLAHDAFLLTLIREQRGKRDKGAGSVKTWILTYDRTLTRFDVRESSDETLPVCLLADDWLQIARPFLPRTDDYDRSFVAMLRHPLVAEAGNLVPLAEMAEALQRLDAVRDTPAPVLAAMVSDATMMQRVRAARDQEAVRVLVDTEAVKYAKHLEDIQGRIVQQNRELTERVERVEKLAADFKEKLAETGGQVTGVTRERDEAKAILQREQDKFPTLIEEARDQARSDANKAIELKIDAAVRDALLKRETLGRRRLTCGVVASVLTIIVVGSLWKYPSARSVPGIALAIPVLAVTWYAAYVWAKHGVTDRAQTKVAEVASIVALLFAFAYAALAIGTGSGAPAAKADSTSQRPAPDGGARGTPVPPDSR